MTIQNTPGENSAAKVPIEDQLAALRTDLDHLKTESKGWIKTWGVYLGILGALVALPKGVLDLATQVRKRPQTSVAIEEITIYHDPSLSSEIVKFPLVVRNAGNQDDVLLSQGAEITAEGQTVSLAEKDFGLFDHGEQQLALRVPKDEVHDYQVSITFNPKTRQVLAAPGDHKLQFQFRGEKDQPHVASSCFSLQDDQVHDLFESNDYKSQTILTKCESTEAR